MKKDKDDLDSFLKGLPFEPSDCPDAGSLLNYFSDELRPEEMKRVDQHLDSCPACLTVLQRLRQSSEEATAASPPDDWATIARKMDRVVYSHLDAMDSGKGNRPREAGLFSKIINAAASVLDGLLKPAIVYASLVFILGLGGVSSYAYFSRPNWFSLAQIQTDQQVTLRTAIPKGDFAEGLNHYRGGRFTLAHEQFMVAIENNPQNYFANYYAALTFLHEAERTLLGVSYEFDPVKVNSGIKYLKDALALAADNNFYRQDCLWLLGKAFLMKGDLDEAQKRFEQILELDVRDSGVRQKVTELLQRL